MAKSFQQMVLLGNLGKDPESRYTAGGTPVTTITVATAESRKNKETGQWEDETEWHRVVLFGRLAELATEYLRKGRQVFIVGIKKTRKWQDKDSRDQYITEIIASEMKIIGARETNREEAGQVYDSEGGKPAGGNMQPDDDIPM